jgi:hypothetical protein
MIWIEREAVDANVGLIVPMHKAGVEAVMMRFAERSDRTSKKGVVVAVMCGKVIGNRRRRDLALGLA